MGPFNFDKWAKLYQTDPVEFDRQRKALLDSVIADARQENQATLRKLQQECDTIRSSQTPVEASASMISMLVESLFDIQDSLADITYLVNKGVVDADIDSCYRKK